MPNISNNMKQSNLENAILKCLYFLPFEYESAEAPNCFLVKYERGRPLPFADIRAEFPLPGNYRFRIGRRIDSKLYWFDLSDDAQIDTEAGSQIILKVLPIHPFVDRSQAAREERRTVISDGRGSVSPPQGIVGGSAPLIQPDSFVPSGSHPKSSLNRTQGHARGQDPVVEGVPSMTQWESEWSFSLANGEGKMPQAEAQGCVKERGVGDGRGAKEGAQIRESSHDHMIDLGDVGGRETRETRNNAPKKSVLDSGLKPTKRDTEAETKSTGRFPQHPTSSCRHRGVILPTQQSLKIPSVEVHVMCLLADLLF